MNNLDKSLRPNANGDIPKVDPTAHIDPTAQIIGKVTIGAETFVGPYAVIRADEFDETGEVHPIIIGPRCNVQDGVIIHSIAGTSVTIDSETSLGHGCIVHGPCIIGKNCFVGFKAVVYNSNIGDHSFISSSATVQSVELTPNAFLQPASAVFTQDTADALPKTPSSYTTFAQNVIDSNIKLTDGYKKLTNK